MINVRQFICCSDPKITKALVIWKLGQRRYYKLSDSRLYRKVLCIDPGGSGTRDHRDDDTRKPV